MFSIWSPVLEQFCGWIKERYPDIAIISGSGVKPMFASDHVDFYVQGFGELALLDLVGWLAGNGSRPRFSLEKVNGKPIILANDHYAAFPMSSLLVRYQPRDFIQPSEWLTIETARGCKFQCKFCNFPVLGVKGDYSRDAEDFKIQLRETYDTFGVDKYIIADETFNDRTEKISKFADAVQELDFDPYFTAYIRADLMVSRDRDRHELARMNVFGHFYGIESFSTASARAVGKGMDGDRLKQGLADSRRFFENHSAGLYRASLGMIIGLPHETTCSLEQSLAWLIDNWQGQGYTVYPLYIPQGQQAQASRFTMDYARYGYDHMDVQASAQENEGTRKKGGGAVHHMIWKNAHMDWYQASAIADKWVAVKYDKDFRPGCFSLAHKLKQKHSIREKINLGYAEFERLKNDDIEQYINCKLNYTD